MIPPNSPLSSPDSHNGVDSEDSRESLPTQYSPNHSLSVQDKSEVPLLHDDDDDDKETTPPQRPSLAPGLSTVIRRPSFLGEDEQPIAELDAAERSVKEAPVTWSSLPNKSQLAVLTLARLAEPLSERSFAAYLFYQLKSFNPNLADSSIASQGGWITASFAAAQFLTAVWWGRAADSERIGRKKVLIIGLVGTFISCMGIGFSRSFVQALIFRIMAGALNGNVGVMRTMISEIIKEKKFQSRAFLLLPMCFNVGIIIGPIIGGFLADPLTSFPSIFGPGTLIGGADGVGWMETYPYALPNLFSGIFILTSALGIVLGLDETHEALQHRTDHGRQFGKWLHSRLTRTKQTYEYTQLHDTGDSRANNVDLEELSARTPVHPTTQPQIPTPKPKSTFNNIYTRNVVLTLMTHFLLALHISSFNTLIFLLLPTPRAPRDNFHLPFAFSSGLGLSTEKVGLATAIIGVIGLPLQILLYPRLNAKLGTLSAYRLFLPFSPLAYSLLPYLTLLPNRAFLVWPALTVVLALQVLSRTFTLPSMVILVNNNAPDVSVLGTIHGMAQSASSAARFCGPVLSGFGLDMGLKNNCVGAVWWAMAIVACCNWGLLWTIREGEGGAIK